MSRDDLLRIYRQFFPFGNAAPFVDRLINILTVQSGAGGIEFSEYVTGLSVISRGRLDEKLYCKLNLRILTYLSLSLFLSLVVLGSFKFCDLDGDGWITKEDLLESIELIHQLMGNMFQLTKTMTSTNSEHLLEERTLGTSNDHQYTDTFTPQNRTNYLFSLMDEDADGRADYNDFKRTVLNDAEIIQGFLVYDGVI